jgi:hypothetical protein
VHPHCEEEHWHEQGEEEHWHEQKQTHVLLLLLQQVQLVHEQLEQQDLGQGVEQQAILIIWCLELRSVNWGLRGQWGLKILMIFFKKKKIEKQ